VRENGVDRFFAVSHLSYDGDVALDLEQRRESAEHHALIFGDDDANGLASFLRAGIQLAPSDFGDTSFTGTMIVSFVPA